MALELEELRKELEDRLRDFSKKIESVWGVYRATDFSYTVKYLAEDIEDRIRKYTGGNVECYPMIDLAKNTLTITTHCIARKPGERTVIEAEAIYRTSSDLSKIELENIYIHTSRSKRYTP